MVKHVNLRNNPKFKKIKIKKNMSDSFRFRFKSNISVQFGLPTNQSEQKDKLKSIVLSIFDFYSL